MKTIDKSIHTLLGSIRETINERVEGSLSLPEAKEKYRELYIQYKNIEDNFISNRSEGYLKGILYNHNINNFATVTAVFSDTGENLIPIAFAGDKILHSAIPEIIKGIDSGNTEKISKIEIGKQQDKAFNLYLSTLNIAGNTYKITTVSSSSFFHIDDFEFITKFIRELFIKKSELNTPVILNYMKDISNEIANFIRLKGSGIIVDHYFLEKIGISFMHVGIHILTKLSKFIVETLTEFYPEEVIIYTLSLTHYLVIFDSSITDSISISKNSIDFNYHGNRIPFKKFQQKIESPKSLYQFIDEI